MGGCQSRYQREEVLVGEARVVDVAVVVVLGVLAPVGDAGVDAGIARR